MTITVYSFEDADGNEVGTFTTQSYDDAKKHAQQYGYRVIGNEYEWSEAVPLDDYTTKDAPRCRHCGAIIHDEPAPDGAPCWVDETGGDCCTENEPDGHEPEDDDDEPDDE